MTVSEITATFSLDEYREMQQLRTVIRGLQSDMNDLTAVAQALRTTEASQRATEAALGKAHARVRELTEHYHLYPLDHLDAALSRDMLDVLRRRLFHLELLADESALLVRALERIRADGWRFGPRVDAQMECCIRALENAGVRPRPGEREEQDGAAHEA